MLRFVPNADMYLAMYVRKETLLSAQIEGAQGAIGTLELPASLRNRNVSLINERMRRSASNGQRPLSLLKGNSIVDVNFVSGKLGVARTTASHLVRTFCDLGILVQPESERQRYRTFVYEELLSILRQGGEPL